MIDYNYDAYHSIFFIFGQAIQDQLSPTLLNLDFRPIIYSVFTEQCIWENSHMHG